MKFTDSQSAAIETKGRNVLVSASAGSGKTRVLVERVMRRLLAGENVNEFFDCDVYRSSGKRNERTFRRRNPCQTY